MTARTKVWVSKNKVWVCEKKFYSLDGWKLVLGFCLTFLARFKFPKWELFSSFFVPKKDGCHAALGFCPQVLTLANRGKHMKGTPDIPRWTLVLDDKLKKRGKYSSKLWAGKKKFKITVFCETIKTNLLWFGGVWNLRNIQMGDFRHSYTAFKRK